MKIEEIKKGVTEKRRVAKEIPIIKEFFVVIYI
jgi:hypothetical protein